jgi:predicted lipase
MIHQQEILDIIGLPMLVYDYVKKFKMDKNETIEGFISSIDNKEDIESLTSIRHEVLNHLKDNSPNGQVIDFINDPDTDLQVGITLSESQKRISVVFRGSESRSDWYYDLMITKHNIKDNIYVHNGFYQQLHINNNYTKIKDSIEKILESEDKKDYEILITGHSLGAALATLFGYLYSKETTVPIKIISFASPRVGNIGFKNDFDNQNNLIHYRITNNRDVITACPMINYKHVGINIHLNSNGSMHIYPNYNYNTWTMFSLFRCWSVLDHSIDLYYERLKNCKWELLS